MAMCVVDVFLSHSTARRAPRLIGNLFADIKSRKCFLEIVSVLVGESEPKLVVAVKENPRERSDAAKSPPDVVVKEDER